MAVKIKNISFASSCQILWQSVKPLLRYSDFLIFKMAPSWDFKKFEILMVSKGQEGQFALFWQFHGDQCIRC